MSKQIVLVNPSGDVLFAGTSLMTHAAQNDDASTDSAEPKTQRLPASSAAMTALDLPAEERNEVLTAAEPEPQTEPLEESDDESCPETVRSAVFQSGLYTTTRAGAGAGGGAGGMGGMVKKNGERAA